MNNVPTFATPSKPKMKKIAAEKPLSNRAVARNSGAKTYITNTPCYKCNTSLRFTTSASCVECARVAKKVPDDVLPEEDRFLVTELRRDGMSMQIIASKFEVSMKSLRASFTVWNIH